MHVNLGNALLLCSLFLLVVPACQQPDAPCVPRVAADWTLERGGVVRGSRTEKKLALVFTGGEFGEGATEILDALQARGVKASFFVTGDFTAQPSHAAYLRRMVADGHYLGPHSHAHLLYCPWEDRNQTLVTREQFRDDLKRNIRELTRFGADRRSMRFFIPPFEFYNEQIVTWTCQMGLLLVNFTRGTRSHADWAPEGHRSFLPSQAIYQGILDYEAGNPDGLNGFLLLMHVGSGPQRADKMHPYVAPLVDELHLRGYTFVRVDELLSIPPAEQ